MIVVLCIITLDSIKIGGNAYEEPEVKKQISTYSLSLSFSQSNSFMWSKG